MPIYEFKCTRCGTQMERRFPMAKTGNRIGAIMCGCGGRAEKIQSATAPPQFRGSGFHETDYGKGNDARRD